MVMVVIVRQLGQQDVRSEFHDQAGKGGNYERISVEQNSAGGAELADAMECEGISQFRRTPNQSAARDRDARRLIRRHRCKPMRSVACSCRDTREWRV